ncbi:ABC transporter permease [Nitrospira sp. KM1]|uniref:ABC transporter permease n=1 Tax=Nitrospira sp. KM1 TaxID=1936990 RepID=UPI001E3051EA|nr:ABC transporter permease [Nitrospira sp. KM1]
MTAINQSSIVIEPSRGFISLKLKAIWDYRELLFFLAWRDLKARYAQTMVGLAWAVLQPLLMMIVLTLVFSRLANIPSEGVPYPVFTYVALVAWTYFAKSLDRGGSSVVAETNLVTKVYFPRLIVPMSAVLGGLVDFGISFVLLFVMMGWYGIVPGLQVLLLPLLIGMSVMTALSISLWLAAFYVKYRDVGAVIPLLTQVWMFASPIVYPLSMVPKDWQWLYNINPMVGLIQSYRWVLLGTEPPDPLLAAQSGCLVIVLLIGGIAYFNKVERTFADVI